MGTSNKIGVFLFGLLVTAQVYSQCGTCTSCGTSSSSGCTWTVSSSSSTDYTVNGTGSQKLCITGGTYTGDITIQGGTIVVASGATFNPASWTFGIFDVYGGVLEIKSGATAALPAMSYNGTEPFTLNNCSNNVTLNGNISVNGSGTVTFNNVGTISGPTRDFSFNGAGTVCNGGTMTLNDFSANGTAGSAINNQGSLYVNGNLSQNGTCPINVCAGSKVIVSGNFSSTGGTMNGPSSCGGIKVSGSSTCTGCTVSGSMDFCDPNATQPAGNPTFNSSTGATIGGSVTQCDCSVLPVDLLFFSADAAGCSVDLGWVTAEEKNNDYFTIERSGDGLSYETLVTVKGAGFSSTATRYRAVDGDPLPGKSYYRLKQTDYDGRSETFKPTAVTSGCAVNSVSVYPTVTKGLVHVYAEKGQISTLTISDVLGKNITTEASTTGWTEKTIDLSGFKKGVYFLNIPAGNEVVVKKIVLQ